jgi:hypothetical protein
MVADDDPPFVLGGSRVASFLVEFFEALLGRILLALQRSDDVEPAFDGDSSLAHVQFELLDGVHAGSLSNQHPRRCASLPKKCRGET